MELFYIRQIIEGDVSQFSYFVEKYKNMSFNIAYRITRNNEDAEEVVQDAFLKAYRSLHKFRQDAKFSTWFYRIVVNEAISKAAKNKRNIVDNIDVSDIPDSFIDTVEATYKSFSDAEQKKVINSAFEALKTEDSLLLTLYYLNENTVDEIATITGIAPGNIKMKLHRARKKMYTLLHKILKIETNV